MQIRKQFAFEAAHVLPYHTGKCSRLHGHSYRLEVALEGGLHTSGDIRRLAEHLAGRVDQDGAGVEADARGELGRAGSRVAGVKIGERAAG